jgi:phosphatidylinositol 4-kinase
VASLFRLSLSLKQYPREDCQDHLRLFIQKMNNWNVGLRVQFPNVPQFHGIALPLSEWCDLKPESRMIVNIREDIIQCFHTKHRVPFMLVLECIEYTIHMLYVIKVRES